MDTQPQDQKVIDLLGKLKQSNGTYPANMMAARREMFMKQAANIGLGIGAGAALKEAAKGTGTGSAASKILELTLVAALVIEAGTVAFLYKDQIAETVSAFIAPTAVVTVQPDTENTISETSGDTQTPLPTQTASETPTVTPSVTPDPIFAQEETLPGNSSDSSGSDSSASNINANATPNPNENQGNQYGLTPRPDRTKENQGGGNGGNNNSGGNNNNGNNGNQDN